MNVARGQFVNGETLLKDLHSPPTAEPVFNADEAMLRFVSDYRTLTAAGRRQARVALCQQTDPKMSVIAWWFFRNYYLLHEDAHFYDHYSPSSSGQAEWAWLRRAFQHICIISHRGSGKSTIIGTEFPLMDLVSQPNSSTLLILGDNSKVQRRFDKIMVQLEHNQRLIEDFGTLRPRGRSGIWQKGALRLENGAQLIGYSVESDRLRGERTRSITIDDPETDGSDSTDAVRTREKFERLLFNVIMPMLRRGTGLFWIGTPPSKRSFIWRIHYGENDPRFESWNRRHYCGIDPATRKIFWPAEYTPEYLAQRYRELGAAAFQAEIQGIPGGEEERLFGFVEAIHGYTTSGEDFRLYETPFRCDTQVHVPPRDGMPAPDVAPRVGDWLSTMHRLIAVDWIAKPGPMSDNAVVHVCGYDSRRDGTIVSIDIWSGKRNVPEVCEIALQMAAKYNVQLIAAEGNAFQWQFVQELKKRGEKFREVHGWQPRIVDVQPPARTSKENKIAGLAWYFTTQRILLPIGSDNPGYRRLLQQVRDFTMSGRTLEHDDELDTLAMVQQRVRRADRPEPVAVETSAFDGALRRGELHLNGVPIALGINLAGDPERVRLLEASSRRAGLQHGPFGLHRGDERGRVV